MKPKSVVLTLTLGLMAGLFACQDQGVVAPDDVISPDGVVVSSAPCWKDPTQPKCQDDPDPPSGGPTLDFSGVLVGFAATDVSYGSKKGIFSATVTERNSITATAHLVLGDDQSWEDFRGECKAQPVGLRAEELKGYLDGGLVGILANAFVDEDKIDEASPDHRIISLVEGDVVRYFWIGPRYTVGEAFPSDATVTDWLETDATIEYTLTGGVIGVRDTGSPKDNVQIACPNYGSVKVTLTK